MVFSTQATTVWWYVTTKYYSYIFILWFNGLFVFQKKSDMYFRSLLASTQFLATKTQPRTLSQVMSNSV